MLGMVVYLVLGCPIRERGDVCIVTIDENSDLLFFEYGWKQLSRPKHLALFCCPSIMWIAVQAMYEDYS